MAKMIQDNRADEELEFIKNSVQNPPEIAKSIPGYKAYPSAVIQGAAKGLLNIGQTYANPEELIDEEEGQPKNIEEAHRLYNKQKEEQQAELGKYLEEKIPVGSNLGPRAIRRSTEAAVEALPSSVFMGPGVISRAAIGGGAAEVAKDLGAGKLGQNLVEMGAQGVPNLKKEIPNVLPTVAGRSERSVIEGAKKLGMSPEEYALTLNQRSILGDFARSAAEKGGRTVERFHRTRQALGRVWNTLRNSPEAKVQLPGEASSRLTNEMSHILSRLPSEQRERIAKDFNDLIGSKMAGNDLIDFWQKMNYYITKGEGTLGQLKEPILKAINTISPELGKDFQLTNQLYGNFHKLAERMGPNVAESLIKAGENGIVLTAVTTGNLPLLKKLIAPLGARQLATEMTTNPRFMNLSSRILQSITHGAPVEAKKAYDQLLLEVGKVNGEAAMKMSNFDFDKFLKNLPEEES